MYSETYQHAKLVVSEIHADKREDKEQAGPGAGERDRSKLGGVFQRFTHDTSFS